MPGTLLALDSITSRRRASEATAREAFYEGDWLRGWAVGIWADLRDDFDCAVHYAGRDPIGIVSAIDAIVSASNDYEANLKLGMSPPIAGYFAAEKNLPGPGWLWSMGEGALWWRLDRRHEWHLVRCRY